MTTRAFKPLAMHRSYKAEKSAMEIAGRVTYHIHKVQNRGFHFSKTYNTIQDIELFHFSYTHSTIQDITGFHFSHTQSTEQDTPGFHFLYTHNTVQDIPGFHFSYTHNRVQDIPGFTCAGSTRFTFHRDIVPDTVLAVIWLEQNLNARS
jgi:hypothetical protein